MSLLHWLFPATAELAELRDATVACHQERDRWRVEASALRVERDTCQLVCETLAATNVALAAALEQAEMLNEHASHRLASIALDSGDPLLRQWVARWLARYETTA